MFPGCGLCTNIGMHPSPIKMALEPDVFPLTCILYPRRHNSVTNSSNVKSDGIDLNRSISFSFVPICKSN